MNKAVIYAALVIGGTAFLLMVKLMWDMTYHMAQMTHEVAQMSREVALMRDRFDATVERLAAIERSVGIMPALAEDVRGMREGVTAMATVIHRGGEQIDRLNPAEMMRQFFTPAQRP